MSAASLLQHTSLAFLCFPPPHHTLSPATYLFDLLMAGCPRDPGFEDTGEVVFEQRVCLVTSHSRTHTRASQQLEPMLSVWVCVCVHSVVEGVFDSNSYTPT